MNIRKATGSITIGTNGGELTMSQIDDFPGYPKLAWFYPNTITNVILFANLDDNYRILYYNNSAFLLF